MKRRSPVVARNQIVPTWIGERIYEIQVHSLHVHAKCIGTAQFSGPLTRIRTEILGRNASDYRAHTSLPASSSHLRRQKRVQAEIPRHNAISNRSGVRLRAPNPTIA